MWSNLLLTILRNVAMKVSVEIVDILIKKLEAKIDKKKVNKDV